MSNNTKSIDADKTAREMLNELEKKEDSIRSTYKKLVNDFDKIEDSLSIDRRADERMLEAAGYDKRLEGIISEKGEIMRSMKSDIQNRYEKIEYEYKSTLREIDERKQEIYKDLEEGKGENG